MDANGRGYLLSCRGQSLCVPERRSFSVGGAAGHGEPRKTRKKRKRGGVLRTLRCWDKIRGAGTVALAFVGLPFSNIRVHLRPSGKRRAKPVRSSEM